MRVPAFTLSAALMFVLPALACAQAAAPPSAQTAESYAVFETKGASRAPAEPCIKGLEVVHDSTFEKYSFLILSPNGFGGPGWSDKVRTCLGEGWQKVPVTKTDGTVLVPTNEILVTFRPGTDAGKIEAFAAEHHFTKVPSGLEKALNSYKFRTGQPSAASDAIVKALTSIGFVGSAETNRIIISDQIDLGGAGAPTKDQR